MRLRMLKDVGTKFGVLLEGMVANIPDNIAEGWLKAGLAMQDKSIEPSEHKKNTIVTQKKTRKRKVRGG